MSDILQEIRDWIKKDAGYWYGGYDYFVSRIEYDTVELPSGLAQKVTQTYNEDETTLIFSVGDELFGVTGDTSSWDGTSWDTTPFPVIAREVTETKYFRAL